ncbi:MAG: alpha-isopropylmalate synthase regulatory domain-containing protein [Patescibacteria group bacterium]
MKSNNAFDVLYYKVKSEGYIKGESSSEATVKIRIGERIVHSVAEGIGPVNALDSAIRKGLLPHFPILEAVKLKDFWVRVNNGDGDAGTGASVEVMISSFNENSNWITKAVSVDIVRASVEALIESFKKAIPTPLKKPILDEP